MQVFNNSEQIWHSREKREDLAGIQNSMGSRTLHTSMNKDTMFIRLRYRLKN